MKDGFTQSFSGARCVLYGMGSSNTATAEYLCKEGAELYIADERKPKKELEAWAESRKIKKYEILKEGKTVKADFVFRSPGVRPTADGIEALVRNGAVLTSEAELFFERARGRIYGITGSDGKTTTSTLAYNLLKKSGKSAYLAGNIGVPLVTLLDRLTENDITVAELSSFQLMTLGRSPNIAAVTSISENHLDYHKDLAEYLDAKCNIFAGEKCKRLVIGTESADKLVLSGRSVPKDITYTSLECECDGVYLKDKKIYLFGKEMLGTSDMCLLGIHNIQNMMTAIGITQNDVSEESIRAVARGFRGVSHRMELVCEKDGKRFYDSSIDSTPSRTLATLACFNKPLTVICGGYDKNLDYTELARELPRYADKLVLTGASMEKIKKAVDAYGNGDIKVYTEADFVKAVRLAEEITPKGGSVLLSPACASFDAFKNFEERGKRFAETVKE